MESGPLEVFFVPFLVPSHMIPEFEMSRLFAGRGVNVTVFTIPSYVPGLRNTIDKDPLLASHVSLFVLPIPNHQVGLHQDVDFSNTGNDLQTTVKLHSALCLLQPQIEDFVTTRRPDCIISDKFYPWTADLALRLGIPRLLLSNYCICGQSVQDALARPDSPHWSLESDYESFVVPGLPDPITLTRSQLPEYVRTRKWGNQLIQMWKEAEMKSYGVVVNSFYELEPEYAEYYMKMMGHKVFHVGPTMLVHGQGSKKVERGGHKKSDIDEQECLSWLDSRKPNSVVYASFGSYKIFSNEQLMEIACGLEASGQQFIWVVHGKNQEEEEEWLPKGFRERTKGRSIIVKGWAPQLLILGHPSVGAFLTHSGWNSVIESVSFGVPMITWPLYAEHFYNEKLTNQVLGIGLEVGNKDWNWWSSSTNKDKEKSLVSRESIEKAVRRLMDINNVGDHEAVQQVETMRRKAEQLGEMAHRAVEEGGSSYRNLTVLIEELMQLRDSKHRPLAS